MAKKKKKAASPQSSFNLASAPQVLNPAAITASLSSLSTLDQELLAMANSKHKQLPHFGHTDECQCGSSHADPNTPAKVDLIVLIDTSGSMGPKAQAIEAAATTAIEEATKKCRVDLAVKYLGIGNQFAGTTIFTTTARDHLASSGCANSYADIHSEEGADTISDLASCSSIWREGACRAIFYVSDEPLDRGAGQDANDTAATYQAIGIAQANQVSVFAHLAPGTGFHANPGTIQDYTDLCEKTGGRVFIGQPATVSLYEELLKDVICEACKGCKRAEIPNYSPCFSIVWADSAVDNFESEDFEVLLIKATNCYDNLAFNCLTIGRITILDAGGNPVPTLPDGRPSIEVFPKGPICFDELPACSQREPACKVREIAIRSQNTVPGNYQLKLENITYNLNFQYSTNDSFLLEIVTD